MIRRRVLNVMLLTACLALGGCFVRPSYTDQVMREQTTTAVQESVSALETVRLAVQTQLRGKAWWRYTDVVVTDAEGTLSDVDNAYSSRQPPSPAAKKMQDRVTSAISDSSDLAQQVRVAVRRHDEPQLSTMLKKLRSMSKRLSKLEQQYK